MKETKRVRVKVKKRKLKIKNFLIFLLLLLFFIDAIYYICNIKIKNIYIINNSIVSDREVIDASKLSDYPSYLFSFKSKVKKNILSNSYIKDVSIVKKNFKFYITISEYKMLSLYQEKILLENGTLVDNIYKINTLPILISDVSDVYDDYVYYFSKISDDVLLKISQIEYTPNDVDNERFLLYMNDGNSVYVTLTKIDKLNKYSSIVSQMEDKKGIIYLDSGDYIELK